MLCECELARLYIWRTSPLGVVLALTICQNKRSAWIGKLTVITCAIKFIIKFDHSRRKTQFNLLYIALISTGKGL